MRLTERQRPAVPVSARLPLSRRWTMVVIGASLLGICLIDRVTGTLPFQHLYYLPIVVASLLFGQRGAWVSSLAAVALYHVANPALLAFAHETSDAVQMTGFIGIGVITAWLRDNARHHEALADTDDLTGLHNLRGFERRLRHSVRTSREAGTPLSLLAVDLDHLKKLNDAHGHLAGAEAVRLVGHIIACHLPAEAFACRYGGDEFVIAIPGQPALAVETVATAMLQTVRTATPVLAGVAFPPTTLSISIGMASLDHGSSDQALDAELEAGRAGETLFRAADAALYEAKRAGRDRVCVG